ncbi:MAG: fumarylacetoacetate hydrolase family protein, partial [Planctomycetota bacterium]
MKFATLRTPNGPRAVGLTADGRFVDLSAVDESLPQTALGLLCLEDGLGKAAAALERGEAAGQFVSGEPLPPVPDPGKILCIGLNYRDHAEETSSPIPTEPIVFGKFGNTLCGDGATVTLPAASQK